MAPYILLRADEPHLFDALCGLLTTRGVSCGRYGSLTLGATTFDTCFPTPDKIVISVRGVGVYADLEQEALTRYNSVADPSRLRAAEILATHDPAMSGRPCCLVL